MRSSRRTANFSRTRLRVDIFGLRRGGTIDGELIAPLRPSVPMVQPGETYLLEVVVRTLKLGHLFTQGTADSNEVWLEVNVEDGESLMAGSGSAGTGGRLGRSARTFCQCLCHRPGR